MRLRPDFDRDLKEQFMDIYDCKRTAIQNLSKGDKSKKLYMTIQVLPKVLKFITNLKKAISIKIEQVKARNKTINQAKYLLLKDNEMLVKSV